MVRFVVYTLTKPIVWLWKVIIKNVCKPGRTIKFNIPNFTENVEI